MAYALNLLELVEILQDFACRNHQQVFSWNFLLEFHIIAVVEKIRNGKNSKQARAKK